MDWLVPNAWRDQDFPRAFGVVGAAAVLLALGTLLQRWLTVAEGAISPRIYWEPSYSIAFLEGLPLPVAIIAGFLLTGLAAWILLRPSSARWGPLEAVNGLRWVAFGVALAFAWAYAGHAFNHYLGQAHYFDRGLLIFSAWMVLRSPLWLPVFVAQVLLSRAQTYHPAALPTPITDELPLRFLCILIVFLAGRCLLRGIGSLDSMRPLRARFPLRLGSDALVLSFLCMIGGYYTYAGFSKILIGESVFDWVLNCHLENFFMASVLNGWLPFLSESSAIAIADWIRWLSVPLAGATLLMELSLLFIAVRLRGSVLLLLGVIVMHVGVAVLNGVFFWKWMVVESLFAGWLWVHRENSELRGLEAWPVACGSILLIVTAAAVFGQNAFTWWNSKWNVVLEVEARGASGTVYDVDYSDFSPYLLYLFLKPYQGVEGGAYGLLDEQDRMLDFEAGDLGAIQRDAMERQKIPKGPGQLRKERNFVDFMRRYFSNRNHRPGTDAIPFLPSSPRIRLRYPRGSPVYRDQEPIVSARARLLESYYTGDSILGLRDEVILDVRIPSAPIPAPTDRERRSRARESE